MTIILFILLIAVIFFVILVFIVPLAGIDLEECDMTNKKIARMLSERR